MGDGLTRIRQADFSAGEFRSVAPQLIPSNGAFSIRNLLLDEDGSAYRRGGSVYKSTSGLGTSGLTFLWSGYLGTALQTVLANADDFASMDGGGVVTNLGGSGLAFPKPAVELGGLVHIGGGTTWDGSTLGAAARTADVYAVAGGKLISLEANRAYESAYNDPTTFAADDFIELGASDQTIAGAGLGDRLFWATTGGVWLVSNVELDITDDIGNGQQRVEHVYPEIIGWGACGLAFWGGALVLPALDGLWLVDGVSAPRLLSRSISDLWRDYVNQGYVPGIAAVYRNHYFLPILTPTATFVKLLVCRLDRPIDPGIGTVFPWTHFEESGAAMAAVVDGPDGVLIGAETVDPSRVVRLPYFDPSTANARDADGSAHSTRITLRDQATGRGQLNTVVAVEAGYELADPSNFDPTIEASYGTGARLASGALWGAEIWGSSTWSSGADDTMTTLPGTAPEDSLGSTPFRWRQPVRTRRMRVRLDTTLAASRYVLRHVELLIRSSTRS